MSPWLTTSCRPVPTATPTTSCRRRTGPDRRTGQPRSSTARSTGTPSRNDPATAGAIGRPRWTGSTRHRRCRTPPGRTSAARCRSNRTYRSRPSCPVLRRPLRRTAATRARGNSSTASSSTRSPARTATPIAANRVPTGTTNRRSPRGRSTRTPPLSGRNSSSRPHLRRHRRPCRRGRTRSRRAATGRAVTRRSPQCHRRRDLPAPTGLVPTARVTTRRGRRSNRSRATGTTPAATAGTSRIRPHRRRRRPLPLHSRRSARPPTGLRRTHLPPLRTGLQLPVHPRPQRVRRPAGVDRHRAPARHRTLPTATRRTRQRSTRTTHRSARQLLLRRAPRHRRSRASRPRPRPHLQDKHKHSRAVAGRSVRDVAPTSSRTHRARSRPSPSPHTEARAAPSRRQAQHQAKQPVLRRRPPYRARRASRATVLAGTGSTTCGT